MFFLFKLCFLKFGEPLPISIDPFCFSINQNFLNLIERASVCFDRSKQIFDRSNLFQIVFLVSLSVSIDRGYFSIDRNLWNMFFKKVRLSFSKGLFQKFFNFSLSLLWLKAPPSIFCHFPPWFLQGFCPWRPVSLFCPFFCILFHIFMHFSCILVGIFCTFKILGFLMIRTYFGEIDQWFFVLWCYNDDSYNLIWSILWFLRNWKF